jgi:hypothetical protein
MKTFTSLKKLTALGLLAVGAMSTSHAQTTLYNTNWNNSYDNWIVVNDVADSPTWDNRGASDGIEAGNTKDAGSEEWIVSPQFDFSDGSTFTLKFERAQSDNATPAGKLDVLYTENWTGDVATSTWQTMDTDITNGLPVGWDGGAGYREYTKVLVSTSATTRLAFKYTSQSGWSDNGTPDNSDDDTNKNRIRVKDFVITTSGSVSQWPLPYSAAWADDLEDWTVVSNKHASKEWAYKAAGTVFMTDGKREQDDWLISPVIVCSGSNQKMISFKAGWKSAQSSNITLYYSTNYAGDQSTADWNEIEANIIPGSHGYGFSGSSLYNFSKTIDLEADAVTFAIKYAAVTGTFDDSQNEIRVKNFKVEEVTATSLEDKKATEVTFYPNPVREILYATVDGKAQAEIYNLAGQLVKKAPIVNQQINVADLIAGQYIIMINHNDNVTVTKFIKK